MLALGDAISLIITNPLFTAILAPIFLKEITSLKKILITMVGFLGAIIISKPTFVREILMIPVEILT